MSRRSAAPPPLSARESALDAVRENIEAFAVAIVVALVIKHFCLEAFRIPTSSMRPTLLGKDDSTDGHEDRIVVDKWAYLFSGPDRWDVAVFRYPLDKSRNFIKRVVGLPGENLRLSHGDVLVRRDPGDPWRIATKPRRVREALYRPVYPPSPERYEATRPPETSWTASGRSDAWRVESFERLEFEGGDAAGLVYAQPIPGNESHGGQAHDVRVRLRVTPRGTSGALSLSWSPEGTWRTTLTLRVAEGETRGSSLDFGGGGRGGHGEPLAATLGVGRPTELEWEVVDGEVHVHVDGVELGVFAADGPAESERGAQALTLSASGAPLTIERLRVDRDLHYAFDAGTHREEFGTGLAIPGDGYVMLGDNTTSSSDSRVWQADGVRLQDGREVWWNVSGESGGPPRRLPGTNRRHVVDLEGVEREWEESDEVAPDPPRRHVSFVPRSHVVGRAFYVFWPAFPAFPRRLGWIH